MTSFTKPHLFVGSRNYSSWSLRGWLCLKWAGIEFDESVIDLDQPGYEESLIAAVLAVSPSGKVPAMRIGTETIWDTIAIAEWAAENARGAPLLPHTSLDRARMRAAMGEMHAGFASLRQDLPMNIRGRRIATGYCQTTHREIARIDGLWRSYRETSQSSGAFLMGARSIVDAFFTPMATRFRTYRIALSPLSQRYAETLLADAAFRQWEAQSFADGAKPFLRERIDDLYEAARS